jgi:hypothetical protein
MRVRGGERPLIALFRPPEVKVGQTRLGGGKGQRHNIKSIVSPFHETIICPIPLGASAIFKWSLKAGPVS